MLCRVSVTHESPSRGLSVSSPVLRSSACAAGVSSHEFELSGPTSCSQRLNPSSVNSAETAFMIPVQQVNWQLVPSSLGSFITL